MRVVSLLVAITLTASPAAAQQQAPIRASIENARETAAQQTPAQPQSGKEPGRKGRLFWSGLALGVAGATTSALGLTAFRTEDSSTGNAPSGAYQACVAQKNSNPIYATNQCDALKGKNLKLLWGGVALGGVGAALMIGGVDTSAELSSTAVGLFHHWRF
jgi:hypothetical protein